MHKLYLMVIVGIWASCTRPHSNAREILRFVDQGNDGWNALGMSFYDDSVYKVGWEYGNYNIIGDTFFLESSKLILIKTNQGCISRALYISPRRKERDTVLMRIVADSIYCNRIKANELYGVWLYENSSGKTDTIILTLQNAWFNSTKIQWDVSENNDLLLEFKGQTRYFSIHDKKNDTIWLTQYPYLPKLGNIYYFKAIKLN